MIKMANFIRTYVMKVGQSGKNGFEIGNIHSAEEIPLHISFSVEKSDSETSNTATIKVWNLSPKSLKPL